MDSYIQRCAHTSILLPRPANPIPASPLPFLPGFTPRARQLPWGLAIVRRQEVKQRFPITVKTFFGESLGCRANSVLLSLSGSHLACPCPPGSRRTLNLQVSVYDRMADIKDKVATVCGMLSDDIRLLHTGATGVSELSNDTPVAMPPLGPRAHFVALARPGV